MLQYLPLQLHPQLSLSLEVSNIPIHVPARSLQTFQADHLLDATELPITSLPLAYVAIGRGIQNYSCSAVGAVPVAIGAIATLYDATSIATSDMSTLNSIPGLAVDVAEEGNDCFQLPAANRNLPVLGNHFFLADGTPTFDLGPVGKSIEAAKNASVAAPTSAPIGPAGTGAVAWLFLTAKPAPYTSVGLAAVYRVETAGGNPTATCNATGTLSMQYSAEYWFYSPAA